MSQQKVDSYKEYKKNKKSIIRKEKARQKLTALVGILVAIVIVGWLGFSVYTKATEVPEGTVTSTEVNMSNFQEYLGNLNMEY